MADLLDRIHGEIRARLRASEGAVREYERLEAALAALSGDPLPVASGHSTARRARASQGRTEPPPPARRSKRAQRGTNRAAALRAIGEHPGASVAELIPATGISRGVLYALLDRLTEHGEIVRQSLPGGRTGYLLAAAPAPKTPTGEPDTLADAPASVGSDALAEKATRAADGPSDSPAAASSISTADPASTAAASPGPDAAIVAALPAPVSSDSEPEPSEALDEATSAEPHGDRPVEPVDAPTARPRRSGRPKRAGSPRPKAKGSAAVSGTAAGTLGRNKPKPKPAARKATPAKPKPSASSGSRRSGRSKPKPSASG
jgi:hypothetical protein